MHTDSEVLREAGAAVAADERSRPEVQTTAGRVRGRWVSTTGKRGAARSAAFLGIPFAEPPVGPLRFAAPVPKAPWSGVLDAGAYGATPFQGDAGVTLMPETVVPGESTLNVNVHTPSPEPAAAGTGLPVLVWIHGGAYISGTPATAWYSGRNFNRDGVVTVTISYRVGFEGFGAIADAPSNRGVRDWLLALEWVRDNISAFGGDPQRVTIAGQSAGGGAVLTLLGMPQAQHLFHQAYASSPALADIAPERADALSARIAALASVAATAGGFGSIPLKRLLTLQGEAMKPSLRSAMHALTAGVSLGPSLDGDLLTRTTPESIAAGIGAGKRLVIGNTDDEFTMVMTGMRHLRAVPKGLLLRVLGLRGRAKAAYLAANAEVAELGTLRLAGRVVTDRAFRAHTLGILAARRDAPTWLYRFSWPSGRFGFAEHCLDVPFFFDCLDGEKLDVLTGAHPPQALADDVHAAAVSFIADGDPGWTRYDDTTRRARVFDVPSYEASDAYASVRPLL